MAKQKQKAKRERQRERERARGRVRAIRNGLITLAVGGAIAAVVVLGVVLGSGGGGGSGTTAGSSSGGGKLAPDVQIQTTSWSGGRTFALSEMRGKPVAMYFVAAWCFTCIPETQAWAKIYPDIKDQAEVIIFDIDTNEDENDLLRFKQQAGGADHLWAMDEGNAVVRAFEIPTLDSTVIIDAEGKIAYQDFSPTGEGKLRDELAKLLDVEKGEAASTELPGQFFDDQGQEHLAPGQTYDFYNSDPPTSGPHAPAPVDWGIYDTPIPKETLVHNAEHGGSLILYNCPGGCPDLVRQLTSTAESYLAEGRKLVLAPYPGMDSKIALVAWTYLDTFDELDAGRIIQFMDADMGADAPEANIP